MEGGETEPVSPATESPARHHHHGEYRRRHRPWYKKLWRSINRQNRAVRTALLIFLVVAAILIGILVTRIDMDALRRRRSMNETPMALAGSLEPLGLRTLEIPA